MPAASSAQDAVKFKATRKIEPTQAGEFKYVEVKVSGEFTFEGELKAAGGGPFSQTLAVDQGKLKLDFGAQLANELGSIKARGTAEPGQPAKLNVEVGTENGLGSLKAKGGFEPGKRPTLGAEATAKLAEFELTFAVNADLDNLFEFTIKIPKEVEFDLKGVTFTGKVEAELKIHVTLSKEGWAAVARGVASAGRAAYAVGRGLIFAGEVGAVTTGAAVGLGLGVGLVGVGWLGFGLYLIGKAGRDGRAQAVAYTFAGGYVDTLVWLTDAGTYTRDGRIKVDHPRDVARFENLVRMDWRKVLQEEGTRYVEHKDNGGFLKVREAGSAALVQSVDRYMRTYGHKAWVALAEQQRRKYGVSQLARKGTYSAILNRQVREGQVKGIDLR